MPEPYGSGRSFIRIDDADDPRVAAYREIRERDLVGRAGQFVAEGEVVLRVLLGPASRFRPVSVLVAEQRLDALAPLLATAAGTPVYTAAQPVLDGIAGFAMHRGILALGATTAPESPDAFMARLGFPALLVVAMGIANHDNLGGIFRNAAAFGASGVLLDSDCCSPLYRKAIRVSVGNTLTVPFATLPVGLDLPQMLAEGGFDAVALSPSGELTLDEFVPAPRTAVLLGSEGTGLPADILARVRSVRIPMAPGVDSLNVATTSGIVLHHLAGALAKA